MSFKSMITTTVFIINFSMFATNIDLILHDDNLYIGETLSLTVKIKKDENDLSFPKHKILLNGKDISNNIILKYFVSNYVERDGYIIYNLLSLYDKKREFYLREEGKLNVVLKYDDITISKSIHVLPVPQNEKIAFDKYNSIKKYLLHYTSNEYDNNAYKNAMKMINEHPNSIYSKLPKIYNTRVGYSNAIWKFNLKVGDKITPELKEKMKKVKLDFYNNNLEFLEQYGNSSGFIKEISSLGLIRNKIGLLRRNPNSIDYEILDSILVLIKELRETSSSKQNILEANKIIKLLEKHSDIKEYLKEKNEIEEPIEKVVKIKTKIKEVSKIEKSIEPKKMEEPKIIVKEKPKKEIIKPVIKEEQKKEKSFDIKYLIFAILAGIILFFGYKKLKTKSDSA